MLVFQVSPSGDCQWTRLPISLFGSTHFGRGSDGFLGPEGGSENEHV